MLFSLNISNFALNAYSIGINLLIALDIVSFDSFISSKMFDTIVNGEIINLYNVTSIYSNIYDFKENVDNRGPLA